MENKDVQQSKKNDMFLNMLFNPTYGTSDFVMEGLNSDNTDIQEFDKYKNNEKVREFFKDDSGKVNEEAMKNAYNMSVMMYNDMSTMDTNEIIKKDIEYDPDSFVRPYDSKVSDISELSKPVEFGSDDLPFYNPSRRRMNMTAIGENREGMWTEQELAQMHKRYNVETGEWENAPEDNSIWEKLFGGATVMARYTKDDEEVKRGEKQEGEYKLNDEGSYYTETLSGRSTYDKEIVSRWDMLTKEGSWWNKYDFFDSDGKNKNAAGVLARNIVTVVPMFIPGVNSYYIGASVAMQTGRFLNSLLKMIDSDNEVFNNVEGWFDSFNMGTSQNSKNNALTFENMVNMGADIFKQLKEQRWIFKNAAKIGGSEKSLYNKLQEKYRTEGYEKKDLFNAINKAKDTGVFNPQELEAALAVNKSAFIQEGMNAGMKSKNILAAELSRIYMTGVTASDTWNQAKQEGASDAEAAFLTLGYMAGEYAILKSNLGDIVMPELRAERAYVKEAIKKLNGLKDDPISFSDNGKKTLIKKALKFGSEIFKGSYHAKQGTKALAANALGEGFEETSEELWADVNKSIFNQLNNLFSEKKTQYSTFDNMPERYGMSFLGGIVGGGLFSGTETFKTFKDAKEMFTSTEAANQFIVNAIKNGKANEIKSIASKMTFADKKLSSVTTIGADEEFGFAPVKKGEKSMDEEMKSRFNNIIDFYDKALRDNGLVVPDNSVLTKNALDVLRGYRLGNSFTSASFLQEANTAATKLIEKVDEKRKFINKLYTNDEYKKPTDDQIIHRKLTDEENKAISEFDKEIEQLRNDAYSYVNGDRASEFTDRALFELNDDLNSSFKMTSMERFAESMFNKRFSELSEKEVETAGREYESFMNSQGKDYINSAYNVFKYMLEKSAPVLSEQSRQWYEQTKSNKDINYIINSVNGIAKVLSDNFNSDDAFMGYLKKAMSSNEAMLGANAGIRTVIDKDWNELYMSELKKALNISDDVELNDDVINNAYNSLDEQSKMNLRDNIRNGMLTKVTDDIMGLLSNFKNMKFINPVVKNELAKLHSTFIDMTKVVNNSSFLIDSSIYNDFEYLDIDKTDEVLNDTSLSNKEKAARLLPLINESIEEEGLDYESLSDEQKNIIDNITELAKEDVAPGYEEKVKTVNNLIGEIMSKNTTSVSEFLDSFDIRLGNKKVSDIVNSLEKRFNDFSGNEEEFSLSKEEENVIDFVSELAEHSGNIINAHRNDNISMGNLFGYVNVRNEMNKDKEDYEPISEVGKEFSDSISFELTSFINRLGMYKMVSDYNNKNQLTKDFKLDARKQSLIYNGIQNTILPILKDIDGIDTSVIEEALNDSDIELIKKVSGMSNPSYDFNDDDKVKNMKGFRKLRKAIYETLKDVSDEDLDKMAEKMMFASNQDMSFNSESKAFSNNMLFWQIAAMASIDPELSDALMTEAYRNGNIAPVSNQTMSTQLMISYILNKDNMVRFSKAKNKAMMSEVDNMVNTLYSLIDSDEFKGFNIDSEINISDKSKLKEIQESNFVKAVDFINNLASSGNPEFGKISKFISNYSAINPIGVISEYLIRMKDFMSSGIDDNVKNKLIKEEKETLSDKLKFIAKNSKYYTKYDSIAMVEGVPGSGKTFGVLVSTIRSMLPKRSNGEYAIKDINKLMDDVWVVSTDSNKESITELAKNNLGEFKDNMKFFNHEQLIKQVFGNSFDGNTKIQKESEPNSKDKAYIDTTNGDYSVKYDYDFSFDSSKKAPSLVIIDESTLLDSVKLSAINEMSRRFGTKVIMIGDSEQTGDFLDIAEIVDRKTGKKIAPPTKNKKFFIFPEMNSSITAPKMGESMRYDNMQHKADVEDFRKSIYNLRYAISDSGFYGDACYSDFGSGGSDVKDIIDKMFSSLGDNEQVMIIGNTDIESNKPIIDYMVSKGFVTLDEKGNIKSTNKVEQYDNVISFASARKSQGREAKYVIYINGTDTNPDYTDYDSMKRNIYTGLSRSKRGTLLVQNGFKFNSQTKTKNPLISTYDKNAIKGFTDKYISIMDKSTDSKDIPEFTYVDNTRTVKPNKADKEGDSDDGSGDGGNNDGSKNVYVNKGYLVPVSHYDGSVLKSGFESKGLIKDSSFKRDGEKVDESADIIDKMNDDNENSQKNKDVKEVGIRAYMSHVYESGNYTYISKNKETGAVESISTVNGINDSINGIINILYTVLDRNNSEVRRSIYREDIPKNSKLFLILKDKMKNNKIDLIKINFNNFLGMTKPGITPEIFISRMRSLVSKLMIDGVTGTDGINERIYNSIVSFINSTIREEYVNNELMKNLSDKISVEYGIKYMQGEMALLASVAKKGNNGENTSISNALPFAHDENNRIMYDMNDGTSESVTGRKYEPKVIKKKVVMRINMNIGGTNISIAETPLMALNNLITMYGNQMFDSINSNSKGNKELLSFMNEYLSVHPDGSARINTASVKEIIGRIKNIDALYDKEGYSPDVYNDIIRPLLLMYTTQGSAWIKIDDSVFSNPSSDGSYIISSVKGIENYGVRSLEYLPHLIDAEEMLSERSSVSGIMVATANVNAFDVPAGVPFVLQSSQPLMSDKSLINGYMEYLSSGKRTASTPKVIKLYNPRVEHVEFMKKMYNIIKTGAVSETNVDFTKQIGNDLTVFSFLYELFSDKNFDETMKMIKSKDESFYNELNAIMEFPIASMNRTVMKSREALKELFSHFENDLKGDYEKFIKELRNENNGMKHVLNKMFVMMYSDNATNISSPGNSDLKYNEDKARIISEILKGHGYDGTTLQVKAGPSVSGMNDIKYVLNDLQNNKYSKQYCIIGPDGQRYNFKLYAKVDAPFIDIEYANAKSMLSYNGGNLNLDTNEQARTMDEYNDTQFSASKVDLAISSIRKGGNRQPVKANPEPEKKSVLKIQRNNSLMMSAMKEAFKSVNGKDFAEGDVVSEEVYTSMARNLMHDSGFITYNDGLGNYICSRVADDEDMDLLREFVNSISNDALHDIMNVDVKPYIGEFVSKSSEKYKVSVEMKNGKPMLAIEKINNGTNKDAVVEEDDVKSMNIEDVKDFLNANSDIITSSEVITKIGMKMLTSMFDNVEEISVTNGDGSEGSVYKLKNAANYRIVLNMLKRISENPGKKMIEDSDINDKFNEIIKFATKLINSSINNEGLIQCVK